MVDRLACPESSRLSGLLDGAAPPCELLDHLARCRRCQEVLEQLAVGESGWLRFAPDGGSDGDRPPRLQQTMEDLKRLPLSGEPAAGAELPPDFLRPSDHPGALGAVGPYPVLEVIGRGGMGVVFKALDRSLARVIAVKVLAPQWAANGTARQRFVREAKAAAAVAHEHVVSIHAVDEADGLPYLVMEYVPGPSLQERIDRDGPLDPKDLTRIALQTAEGLAAAHAQGLVHRDVKPANILLENGVGRARLTDFGLARAVDDAGCTQQGTIAGTPEYMAPEQARGQVVDHRADLYSLGCVIYAACTGRPPFRAATSLGVIHLATTSTPPPIRAINPDVPAELEVVVMTLLAKDPADRFRTAGEVVEELRRVLVRMLRPDLAPPERPAHRRGWAAVAALVLVAGLAAAAVFTFRTREGTLVVEVDDPDGTVLVEADGESVVVKGVGVRELRLRPGAYRVTPVGKDGRAAPAEEVVVERGGRTVLRARFLPPEVAQTAPPPPQDMPRMVVEVPGPPLVFRPVSQTPWTGAGGFNASPSAPVAALVKEFDGHTGSVRGVAVHPDGKRMVSVTGWPRGDGTLRVWDLDTGHELRRILIIAKGNCDALTLTPDGNTIVVGASDGSIRLYDWNGDAELLRIGNHKSEITCVTVSPIDRKIAAAYSDGSVRVWDPATGRGVNFAAPGSIPSAHTRSCRAVAYSPDGKILASGSIDGTLKLWNAETGEMLKQIIPTHGNGAVWALAFADGGRTIVTAGAFATAWDVATGRARASYAVNFIGNSPVHDHPWGITALAVSPDGTRLATCGYDGTARVWELASGKPLFQMHAGVGAVWAVAFTRDGKRVLSGGGAHCLPDNNWIPGDQFTIRMWAIDDPGRK